MKQQSIIIFQEQNKNQSLMESIKRSMICQHIQHFEIDTTRVATHIPRAGDVAVFKVLSLGKHTRIQTPEKHNRHIFPGDLILCAFGNRYATNQIEGYVPKRPETVYHILGQGGVVGIVRSLFKPLEDVGPTTLKMIGYAVDANGEVCSTIRRLPRLRPYLAENGSQSKVILSVGTSMDSGKTTTAGYLCRGLKKAGHRVAYMKLTGTVFSKDADFALDCGADVAIDFSHLGYPSTYLCDEPELLQIFYHLRRQLEASSPEYIVVEIADGLLQRETGMLLRSERFRSLFHTVIFSAGDSLSVSSGLQLLGQWNISPFAVGGLFTRSPLLVAEVKAHCRQMPVVTLEDLERPEIHDLVLTGIPALQNITAHVA